MRLSHVGADVLLLAGEAQADVVVGAGEGGGPQAAELGGVAVVDVLEVEGGGAEGLLEGAQPAEPSTRGSGRRCRPTAPLST